MIKKLSTYRSPGQDGYTDELYQDNITLIPKPDKNTRKEDEILMNTDAKTLNKVLAS